MKPLATFLAALIVAVSIPAQLTRKVVTTGSNKASAAGRNPQSGSISPGMDVTAGRTLAVIGRSPSGNSRATLNIGGSASSCILQTFGDLDTGACSNCMWCGACVISASGDVVWTLSSPGGVTNGTLRIVSEIGLISPFANATADVDIGDDGSFEFQSRRGSPPPSGTEVCSIPLSVGPATIKIRLRCSGMAVAGGNRFTSKLLAEFLPSGGTVTKDAPACQSGVDLRASHRVWQPASGPNLETTDLVPIALPPGAHVGVYGFGGQSMKIPLGPTGCLLRNDATVLVIVTPANPRFLLQFPPGSTPLTFYAQFAFATRATGGYDLLHTSDSLLFRLK